jgi:nucleoside-diphosphate-sugar epimerase
VEDAVAAYLAIWDALGAQGTEEADPRGIAGEAYNAGGATPHRVLDVVETICALTGTGVDPDIRGAGVPAGEIDRQWVDHSKLSAATGWQPLVGLEEGLRRTIDWYRDQPEWLGQASQALT